MRKIEFEMSVSTRYVGSEVTDTFSIEVDDNATEEEIEKEMEDVTRDWMHEQIDWGWKIISDKVSPVGSNEQ
jgi:hypothetical protein